MNPVQPLNTSFSILDKIDDKNSNFVNPVHDTNALEPILSIFFGIVNVPSNPEHEANAYEPIVLYELGIVKFPVNLLHLANV